MSEVWKSREGVLPSADLGESADSARQNGNSPSLNQLNSKAKDRAEQCRMHENIETQSRENAEKELENELKILGADISDSKGEEYALNEVNETEILTTEDEIKTYKKELVKQGKTAPQILKALIAKYENTLEAKVIVANCKNFLKLHQYAESKPPQERKAIQRIISNADFTAEDSFETALSEIQSSTEISTETKTDLQRKFASANIQTVSGLDFALGEIKKQKAKVEKELDEKQAASKSLKREISALEDEVEKLPLDDPKCEELKLQLKQKQEALEMNQSEIKLLEAEKPKHVSFLLRENFKAKQNPDGSRCVQIVENSFQIQLPENTLFMSRKNMLSINLAFIFNAFHRVGMDVLFSPRIKSGEVPDKKQRLFGSRVLKQLGFPTDRILSQSNILQLEKDLGNLKKRGSSTGVEDLQELGILDEKLDVDLERIDACLGYIRKNRGKDIRLAELNELSYLSN